MTDEEIKILSKLWVSKTYEKPNPKAESICIEFLKNLQETHQIIPDKYIQNVYKDYRDSLKKHEGSEFSQYAYTLINSINSLFSPKVFEGIEEGCNKQNILN